MFWDTYARLATVLKRNLTQSKELIQYRPHFAPHTSDKITIATFNFMQNAMHDISLWHKSPF